MGPELIAWILFLGGWAAGWNLLKNRPCRAPGLRYKRPMGTAGLQKSVGRTSSSGAVSVSVIIPARDEEHNLPALIESLASQNPPSEEILVVDDGSTDRTAEIARAAGARVIASAPLPDGWRGKAWACQQGADAAAHETLIFMDADTRFEPGGLQAVCNEFAKRGGALSLAAFQTLEKPVEQLSAFFIWVMTAASELFGPFLMVSKADYQKAGGHAAVKNQVLENVHLAAEFRRAGVSIQSLRGKEALSIHMYPGGFMDLSNGWKKAFATGAHQTPPHRMVGIIFWLSTAAGTSIMLPVSVFTNYSLSLWGTLYAAFVFQLFVQLRRLGQFSFLTALFYPVFQVFFFGLFAQSACQKQQNWKGRTYVD